MGTDAVVGDTDTLIGLAGAAGACAVRLPRRLNEVSYTRKLFDEGT